MLVEIHLRHFTLIESLDLQCHNGMTVMTGETGAGKSIVIDAIELALGSRLSGNVVKTGHDKCDITLVFDVKNNEQAKQWLNEQDFAADNECIIRRVISKEGRSRCYINGHPTTVQSAAILGELLINIHGQHEHQSLLVREKQRSYLDAFAGHQKLCDEVLKHYQQWQNIRSQMNDLEQQGDQASRREFLRYQLDEFEKLGLQEGEYSELEREHKQLANVDHIRLAANNALEVLTEQESNNTLSLLFSAQQQLAQLIKHHPPLESCQTLLNQAQVEIEEASDEIKTYLDHIDVDPERLYEVEQRLSLIHEMARKHRVEPEHLHQLQQQLSEEFAGIDQVEARLSALQQQLNEAFNHYQNAANRLTKSREKAAKHLSKEIGQHLTQLALGSGSLQVHLQNYQDDEPRAHGHEQCEFLFCANVGQSFQPLSKVASGGELSRISLAIQVILAEKIKVPVLIFDEVDVGIGGATAEIVGKLLQALSANTQVFCITHLAQVAAFGKQHWQVHKEVVKNNTQTQIRNLTAEEKIFEIARMMGGVEVSKQTIEHAKAMIESV